MAALHFLIFLALGIVLDRVIYWRIISTLGRPGFYPDDPRYRKFLYPRILYSTVAMGVMFSTGGSEGASSALCLVAAAIFLLSPCYGAYCYLMGR